MTVMALSAGSQQLDLVSVYIPSNTNNLKGRLEKVFRLIPEPRLVMGDFNGHHMNWGSYKNNKQGIELNSFFESQGLIILNDGSSTFQSGFRSTAIDISLASPSLLPKMRWSIKDDLHGSDHFPIEIISSANSSGLTRRARWRYDGVNWVDFGTIVHHRFSERNPTNIEDFTRTLFDAATEAIPRSGTSVGRKSTIWYNDDIGEILKNRKQLLRGKQNLKRSIEKATAKGRCINPLDLQRLEDLQKQYNEANNLSRKVIRETKDLSWKEFLEGITADQPVQELWHRINSLSGKKRQLGFGINKDGYLTRDPKIVAETLAEYFASLSSYDKYSEKFKRDHPKDELANIYIPDSECRELNEPFTREELKLALSKSKGKSDGHDNIGYPLLCNLPPVEKFTLLECFNDIWKKRTFPQAWRHSLIIPIPKANLNDGDPSHYRPISLTCCLSKVMERMVSRRLIRWLDDENLLDHRQHAFRPGKGTGSYFADLVQTLSEGKAIGHTDLVALDLAKAFNRAWTPIAINQLLDWGISGNIMHFLIGFLTNRTFQVSIGNHLSSVKNEETGVPQGAVIATLLFILTVNPIFTKMPRGIFLYAYADDLLLVVYGKTPKQTRKTLTGAVAKIADWAESSGFELAPSKCEMLHINPPGKNFRGRAVFINDTEIPVKHSIRILGVQIDRYLTFKKHAEITKKACETRLNMLKVITNKQKKTNRELLLRVHGTVVEQKLLYGAELYALGGDQVVKQLAPTYNRGIRIISRLLPCTPADDACVEIGTLPFRLKFTKTVCNRVIGHTERTLPGPSILFLHQEAAELFRASTGLAFPTVARRHWTGTRGWNQPRVLVEKPFERYPDDPGTNARLPKIVDDYLKKHHGGRTIRYTDGSKNEEDNTVGIGVTGNRPISNSLPGEVSIFSAEAAAISLAIVLPSSRPLTIVTDCRSVLEALQSYTSKHAWIQEIQNNAKNTIFLWVRSHIKIDGNEEADRLSKAGRYLRRAPSFTEELPAKDAKNYILKMLQDRWKWEWSLSYRELHRSKPVVDKWEDPQSSREQRIISRLRVGYSRLSHRMDGSGPFRIKCPICNENNTTRHVLLYCPQYKEAREANEIGDHISEVLGDDRIAIERLIQFIKDCGLYNKI